MPKLHKIEHKSGPVYRSFKIVTASVGFVYSRISIMLPKNLKGRCHCNEILHFRAQNRA